MIHCFDGVSADEAWGKAATALMTDESVVVQASRAGETRELLHAVVEIADPRQRWVARRRDAINVAFALAEVIWILDGRNDSAFPNYFYRKLPDFAGHGPVYHGAYGERLRARFGLDQLERAALALKAESVSRQVVLQIWSCADDLPKPDGKPMATDIPCNLVSILKARNGKLDWTQVMRSNDAFRGMPQNIVQFTSLQEVMAGWMDLSPGTYTHWSDSLHFYAKDITTDPIRRDAPPLPISTNSICLPKAQFDSIWPDVRRLAQSVTDEQISSDELQSMIDSTSLPPGWANILRMLTAEGARRRGDFHAIAEVVSRVSDPALRELWSRWAVRVGVPVA